MSENTTIPTSEAAPDVATAPDVAKSVNYAAPLIRRIKRGRHPDVTPGAFGNKRKHNGIKFRTSALLNRFA